MDNKSVLTAVMVVCLLGAVLHNTMSQRATGGDGGGFYKQQLIKQGPTVVDIHVVDTGPKVSEETPPPEVARAVINCEDWSFAACPQKTCPNDIDTYCSWNPSKASCACLSEDQKREMEEEAQQERQEKLERRATILNRAKELEADRQRSADEQRKNMPATDPPPPEPVVPIVKTIKPVELKGPTMYEDLKPGVHHWLLGACAVTANSGHHLREWIELQFLAGVGHVWVINDNEGAKDDTAVILQEYEKKGFVTVIPGRPAPKTAACANKKYEWLEAECISPKMCYQHMHQYVDWFVMIDTDEFMYPQLGCSLEDHVRNHCDPFQPYVLLRWERFGSSGWRNYPDGIMLENFLSSGGDCSDHHLLDCEKNPFDYCLECRHTKVMYNVKHCVEEEHVGWTHTPVNTTAWKEDPVSDGFVKSEGFDSNWKTPVCTAHHQEFPEDAENCRLWLLEGGGSKTPQQTSQSCCAAGFGYNHYGVKNTKSWEEKMQMWTRRAYKPESTDGIDLNTTISSSALRFVRQIRKNFERMGEAVSDNTKFLDVEKGKSCFSEKGFRYQPNRPSGSIAQPAEANTASECCKECWETETETHKCGGWTFHTSTASCFHILSSKEIVRNGTEIGRRRFPSSLLPAFRHHAPSYTSGIPLYEGECLI